jgi:hypothetical protein
MSPDPRSAAPQNAHSQAYCPTRFRCTTISRGRIFLLLLAGALILAFSIYVEGSGYTNLTSLPWPKLSQSSADLTLNTTLSELFSPAEEDHSWMAENDRTIASIFRCTEQGNCSRNQTKGACENALSSSLRSYGRYSRDSCWRAIPRRIEGRQRW